MNINIEVRKLKLIEEILNSNDTVVLEEIEKIILKTKLYAVSRKSFTSFAGMLSDKEVVAMEQNIKEGCGQIYPNDWK